MNKKEDWYEYEQGKTTFKDIINNKRFDEYFVDV